MIPISFRFHKVALFLHILLLVKYGFLLTLYIRFYFHNNCRLKKSNSVSLPSIETQAEGNKPSSGKRPLSDTKRKILVSKPPVVSWQFDNFAILIKGF